MGIKISGRLSEFGALAIALLVLAFVFQQAGSMELSSTAQAGSVAVMGIIMLGALISMKTKLFGFLR